MIFCPKLVISGTADERSDMNTAIGDMLGTDEEDTQSLLIVSVLVCVLFVAWCFFAEVPDGEGGHETMAKRFSAVARRTVNTVRKSMGKFGKKKQKDPGDVARYV